MLKPFRAKLKTRLGIFLFGSTFAIYALVGRDDVPQVLDERLVLESEFEVQSTPHNGRELLEHMLSMQRETRQEPESRNKPLPTHPPTKNSRFKSSKRAEDKTMKDNQDAQQYVVSKKQRLESVNDFKATEKYKAKSYEKKIPNSEHAMMVQGDHQTRDSDASSNKDEKKDGEDVAQVYRIFDPRESLITFYDKEEIRLRKVYSKISKRLPLSPAEAIKKYGHRLPAWERAEIANYPEVWYLGLGANKTKYEERSKNNFGFTYGKEDEDTAHYKVVVGDHIGYRYEILEYLGGGFFGTVVLAKDWSHPQHEKVALKLFRYDGQGQPASSKASSGCSHTQCRFIKNDSYTVREVDLMKYIEKNVPHPEYNSRLKATFRFRNHKCVILELLGTSLREEDMTPVTNMTLFRRYAKDILTALAQLNDLNIVHGDFKASNVMYIRGKTPESNGQLLKLADFGLGCIPGDKEFSCPGFATQSRHYRSPEELLDLPPTLELDMFSFGIVLAEFYLGRSPITGENDTDQFSAIMEVLGLPPTYMIVQSKLTKFYQKAICYEKKNGFRRRPYRKPLYKLLDGIDPILYDLIARCLEYDPKLRITARDALKHPFVTGENPSEPLPTPISMQRLLGYY